MMFNCVFVTFPCGTLGQVLYLIVSIPDLCRFSYFEMHSNVTYIAVVLPAPLWPRRDVMCPSYNVRFNLFKAGGFPEP